MLNNCICVGKLLEKKEEEGKIYFKISIPSNEKDEDGEYIKNEIQCIIRGENMNNAFREYCKVGDILGVKGFLANEKTNMGDFMFLNVDKITFLSARKEEKEND